MDAMTPTDQPRTRLPRAPRSAGYIAVLIAAIALLVVMINVTTGESPSQPPRRLQVRPLATERTCRDGSRPVRRLRLHSTTRSFRSCKEG